MHFPNGARAVRTSAGGDRDRGGATRPPAVAGRFYECRPEALRAQLDACFAGVRRAPLPSPPLALVAPHAGYVFSGEVAASAWETARARKDLRRVVLLGPSHHVPVRGLGTSSAARFATPLGDIPLDLEAIARVGRLPFVETRDDAHAPEHSIEVQLPFLLAVLGPVPIVPLVVGAATAPEVAAAIGAAGGLDAGARTLTVVSTDLSHYLPDAAARKRDLDTCDAIEQLDAGRIDGERACGHRAVAGLLVAANAAGLIAIRLDLRTSADAGGNRDGVVGYAAFAFVRDPGTGEGPD
jgi:MEMO1 family protein